MIRILGNTPSGSADLGVFSSIGFGYVLLIIF